MHRALVVFLMLAAACSTPPNLPADSSWDPNSGVFAWGQGQITLPPEMKYARIENETFAGQWISDSGRIVINHDIGPAAGAWAQNLNARVFEEKMVDGARVWLAQRLRGGEGDAEVLVAVTFPDNGCANFFMLSKTMMDISVIRKLAATFRPKNTQKAAETCEQR
jgi:hypothetical protein